MSEVGQILKDCAWRVVKKAQERSKLSVLWNLIRRRGKVRCVQVERKGLRCILSKLRDGTVELWVEISRWVEMKWEDRICAQCNSGEVEDVEHFLLR